MRSILLCDLEEVKTICRQFESLSLLHINYSQTLQVWFFKYFNLIGFRIFITTVNNMQNYRITSQLACFSSKKQKLTLFIFSSNELLQNPFSKIGFLRTSLISNYIYISRLFQFRFWTALLILCLELFQRVYALIKLTVPQFLFIFSTIFLSIPITNSFPHWYFYISVFTKLQLTLGFYARDKPFGKAQSDSIGMGFNLFITP